MMLMIMMWKIMLCGNNDSDVDGIAVAMTMVLVAVMIMMLACSIHAPVCRYES